MTLWAHVYGGYASYDNAYTWTDDDYRALKFVQALKGEPINGYASMRRPNGVWITIRSDAREGAFRIWGEWATAKVAGLYPAGALLVPIPSAACVDIGGDEKGQALANAVAIRAAGCEAVQALCWAEAFTKASKGGPRDYTTLYDNVRVNTELAKRPVVLIDDVITGGGHAKACAAALRWAGHEVEHVVAAAHTVHSPPADGMFTIPPWDVEADPLAGGFGI